MKLSIRTADLSRALFRVQGVADKKSTMPILAHVLMEASSEKGLVVSATDLDVGISGAYPADVTSPGSVAIHARNLFEIIKSLNTEKVVLEKKENSWLEVQSGASRFKLVGMVPEEFPALPSHGQVNTFKISSALLSEMIDRTIFCVSNDDNRHNLSGVYCSRTPEGMLRMVATDGHRLALCDGKPSSTFSLEHNVIVPRKGFQELRRVIADAGEPIKEVELGFSKNSGVLHAGSVTLTTRLVEGQFPDYEQVIPSQAGKAATIVRAPFDEALKRVSLLSQGRGYGVRLNFTNNSLELVAEDPEFGEARENIPVEYTGDPLSIGFNARYLREVLALIHAEQITFELTDDLSPAVMKPAADKTFLAVVMPMRI